MATDEGVSPKHIRQSTAAIFPLQLVIPAQHLDPGRSQMQTLISLPLITKGQEEIHSLRSDIPELIGQLHSISLKNF